MLLRNFNCVYRFVPKRVFFCSWLGVVALFAVTRAADEFRTWSDASGSFKVEAKLIKVEGSDVYLESKAGKALKIPTDKLSAADQRFLTDSQPGANPFQAAEPAIPFTPNNDKPKPGTVPARPGTGPGRGATKPSPQGKQADALPPSIELQQMLTTDRTKAKKIKVPWTAMNNWKLTPGDVKPIELENPQALKLAPIRIFEGLQSYQISPQSKRLAALFTCSQPKETNGYTRLILFDLSTGKELGSAFIAGTYNLLGLDSKGEEVWVCEECNRDKISNMEIWKLGTKGIERLRAWPMQDKPNFDPRLHYSRYVTDKLGFLKHYHNFEVWDLTTGQLLISLEDHDGDAAFSPDNRYVILTGFGSRGIHVFDTQKLDFVASQSYKPSFVHALTFSPDGKQLAVGGRETIEILDFATGEPVSKWIRPTSNHSFVWPTPDYMLTSNQYLLNMKKQAVFWTYGGIDKAVAYGGYFWIISGNSFSPALIPLKLPHATAETVAKTWEPPPIEYLLKPGDVLAVDVNGIGDAKTQVAFEEAILTDMLKKGFKYSQQSPIRIVASVQPGQNQPLKYTKSGEREAQQYNFNPNISKIQILNGDNVIYEMSGGGRGPGFLIRLKEGETIEEHLQNLEKADYGIFLRASIPANIPNPKQKSNAGGSSYTEKGLVDK